MTTSLSDPLVDPQQAAFFAGDPSILAQTPPATVEQQGTHAKTVVAAGVALSVAFLVVRHHIAKDLINQPPPQVEHSKNYSREIWKKYAPLWMKLSVPAIQQVYELGAIEGMTQNEFEMMASDYAMNLGEFLNETSAESLSQGFLNQLGYKWSEQLAWKRAAYAYGLDSQQMKSYVNGVLEPSAKDVNPSIIPPTARVAVDKALLVRADRIGQHEAWHALQSGKAIAWMSQQHEGEIPEDAEKQWITAEDERVCPVCAPLHKQRVKLHEQFILPDKRKVWAPGVHVNCRCDLRLIYPEVINDPWTMVKKDEGDDPYDRDRRGRFSPIEERGQRRAPAKATPVRVADRVVDPQVEELMAQARELQDEQEKIITRNPMTGLGPQVRANPMAALGGAIKASNPMAALKATTGNPLAQLRTANPLVRAVNPMAEGNVRPVPMMQRQILVVLPSGEHKVGTPEEFDEDDLQYQQPLYLFAHEHHRHQIKVTDHGESDIIDFNVGQPIHFDYQSTGESTQASVGRAYSGNIKDLIEEASHEYNDLHDYDMPDAAKLVAAFHEKHKEFRDSAMVNVETLTRNLQPDEMRKILKDAGVLGVDDLDLVGVRDKILFANPSSNIMHSYIEYMEDRHPEAVGSAGTELKNVENSLMLRGLVPHVPSVFIMKDWHSDTSMITGPQYPSDLAMMGGKYRVTDVVFRSAELEMGNDRPANIKGINMVYLEPIEDIDDDAEFFARQMERDQALSDQDRGDEGYTRLPEDDDDWPV